MSETHPSLRERLANSPNLPNPLGTGVVKGVSIDLARDLATELERLEASFREHQDNCEAQVEEHRKACAATCERVRREWGVGSSRRTDLEAIVAKLEWSGRSRGPGSGYMTSGGDGPLVPSCPLCRGIEPTHPQRGCFIESVHGHRDDCFFAAESAARGDGGGG